MIGERDKSEYSAFRDVYREIERLTLSNQSEKVILQEAAVWDQINLPVKFHVISKDHEFGVMEYRKGRIYEQRKQQRW